VYAPALYDVEVEPGNGLLVPVPRAGCGAPYPVRRRIVMDLDRYPSDRIVVRTANRPRPRLGRDHARLSCGLPVCQAGYVYRPTRERDPNQIRDTVIRSIRATGYESFSCPP